jgi:hypothetical protein
LSPFPVPQHSWQPAQPSTVTDEQREQARALEIDKASESFVRFAVFLLLLGCCFWCCTTSEQINDESELKYELIGVVIRHIRDEYPADTSVGSSSPFASELERVDENRYRVRFVVGIDNEIKDVVGEVERVNDDSWRVISVEYGKP